MIETALRGAALILWFLIGSLSCSTCYPMGNEALCVDAVRAAEEKA